MFVVIIHFPSIKEGKGAEFLEWFARSNKKFAEHAGFVGRRLLKPVTGGAYTAVMELKSREAFEAMRQTTGHDEAARQIASLLDGQPTIEQYEVIIG
jgi:heme-degrading monooxygenase HmoA